VNDWLAQLERLAAEDTPAVLVTVVAIAGSGPREAGARMIVTAERSYGTIGGGNLEYQAIAAARERALAQPAAGAWTERYPLGANLGQCCGGVVTLHFEVHRSPCPGWPAQLRELGAGGAPVTLARPLRAAAAGAALVIGEDTARGSLGDPELDAAAAAAARRALVEEGADTATLVHELRVPAAGGRERAEVLIERLAGPDFCVVLFGAGHVGQALVEVLARSVPCRLLWVDSRAELLPGEPPAQVEPVLAADPVQLVPHLPAGAYCLVMTHSHALDQALCEALLRRRDFAFLGLIGSATKRRRFLKRLREAGIPDTELARLTCPIGLDGIRSKLPGAIGVSVAAQLLQLREAAIGTEAGRAPGERVEAL